MTEEIESQIALIKDEVKDYIAGKSHANWDIFYIIPQLGSSWKGPKRSNSDNDGHESYQNFCATIDDLHKRGCSQVKIQVWVSGGKGNPKRFFIDDVYSFDGNSICSQQQPNVDNRQEEKQQQQQQSFIPDMNVNAWEMFGQAFLGMQGLGGVNEQFGVSGVLLEAQKRTMQRDFEKQKQLERMVELEKDNSRLKAELEAAKNEILSLKRQIEKLEDENDELQEKADQFDEMSIKNQRIAAVGSLALSSAAESLISKSPILCGLFGIGQQEPPSQNQTPQSKQQEEVKVEEDKEDDGLYQTV